MLALAVQLIARQADKRDNVDDHMDALRRSLGAPAKNPAAKTATKPPAKRARRAV